MLKIRIGSVELAVTFIDFILKEMVRMTLARQDKICLVDRSFVSS